MILIDEACNWKKTTYKPAPGSGSSSSSSSSALGPEPSALPQTDRRDHNALNQITRRRIETSGGPWDIFAYDLNGNLLDDGERLMEYDAFNRLARVRRKSDDAVIGSYYYDARGYRIRKIVSNGGLSGTITDGTFDCLYNHNWQCVEERDPSGGDVPEKQYLWGIYIDELIQMREEPDTAKDDRYSLRNMLYTARALTDVDAVIIETYDTDAYGNTLIYDAPGTGGDWWADDATKTEQPMCPLIFQGKMHDEESGLVYNRERYYMPRLARFLQPDRLEYVDGMNRYEYLGSSPVNHLDPQGLRRATLEFNAFIPTHIGKPASYFDSGTGQFQDVPGTWFDEPWDPRWIVSTDNRGFGGGKSRVWSRATVELNDVGNLEGGGPYFTTESDLTERRREAWFSDPPGGIVRRRTATPSSSEKVKDRFDCYSQIRITASGNYPFGSGPTRLGGALVPNIDYSVTFRLTKDSSEGVYIVADGTHNLFPNYEGLVDGGNIYKFPTQGAGPGIGNRNSSTSFVSNSITV